MSAHLHMYHFLPNIIQWPSAAGIDLLEPVILRQLLQQDVGMSVAHGSGKDTLQLDV